MRRMVLSRVLGFCKDTYSLNTVYSLGGLTVDEFGVVCVVGIVGDVQYIFTRSRRFDVTYLDSISVSVSREKRKPAGR
jgi:hypothetical protein